MRGKETLAISQVADHLSRHSSNLSIRLSASVLPPTFFTGISLSRRSENGSEAHVETQPYVCDILSHLTVN